MDGLERRAWEIPAHGKQRLFPIHTARGASLLPWMRYPVKPKIPKQRTQSNNPKAKIPNQRPQAKDLKQQILNQSSQTKCPKPKIPIERSQAQVQRKIPSKYPQQKQCERSRAKYFKPKHSRSKAKHPDRYF